MLELPGNLATEKFLSRYWQRHPLFAPSAIHPMRPVLTRNELAWLATLDDVESRIVFTDRGDERTRYRVESGPFDDTYLSTLPKRDWSLLVHDVEKHLPAMRRMFAHVPFIPDWRIDDLMISFAAPGGSVGPHRDNYDVFLCQGIGTREWRLSTTRIGEDSAASDDLALLMAFEGDQRYLTHKGDVLYLPPGVAHWGTAQTSCMTYSIGMRAPPGYADPELKLHEVRPGYISPAALTRAGKQQSTLGCVVTQTKEWLQPVPPGAAELEPLLNNAGALRQLRLHGMTRIAYDDSTIYLNGRKHRLTESNYGAIATLCARRRLDKALVPALGPGCLRWLLKNGAFEIPEIE